MKVVCINNDRASLILGKTYEVNLPENGIRPNVKLYYIIDEDNINFGYSRERFLTIEEYRDKKVNDILQ